MDWIELRQAAGNAMNMLRLAGAGALVMVAYPVSAKPLPLEQINFGPEPEWTFFRDAAEASVKYRLVDPDSAKFSWPYGLHKGGYKPFLEGWVYGYYTCGEVNSRNRMGGYAGGKTFIVVMNYDRIVHLEFGGDRGGNMVDEACAKAVEQGLFPPVPGTVTSQPTGPSNIRVTAYGFAFNDIRYGAYVAEVDEATKRAGLDAGMVITSFNGIKLQGLRPEVMGQIMNAASGPVTISVMNGTAPIQLLSTAVGTHQ